MWNLFSYYAYMKHSIFLSLNK